MAGIEHSWGSGQARGSRPPHSRGIQKCVQNSLCVPGVRSSSPCTNSLEGQPAGNILVIPSAIPQNIAVRQAESWLFGGIPKSPEEILRVSQGFAAPGMESQGVIPRFHQEHLFGELQVGREWKPWGAQIEKKGKMKLPKKKETKSPVLPSVFVPRDLGTPVPRVPSESLE